MRVPFGRGVAGGKSLGSQNLDHVSVFGMQHGQHTVLGSDAHDFEDLPILQTQPSVVGGEYLQGSDPLLDQARNLGLDGPIEAGDIHVQSVINGGLARGFGLPGIHIFYERVRVERHEVQHGRCSAKCSCLHSRVVIVRRNGVEHGQVQMCMGIDPPRHQELPGGIHHLSSFDCEVLTDSLDGLALDVHIPAFLATHGEQRAAFYQ